MKKALTLLLACLLPTAVLAQEASTSHISNLRSGPSSSSKIVGRLPVGTSVMIVSKFPNSGYVRVQTAQDGTTGWVLKRNVTAAKAPPTNQSAPASATSKQATAPRAGDLQIYPNSRMTPGTPDPTVTQSNLAKVICNKGWSTDSVRPADSVTNKIKGQTMTAYGFTDSANNFELDHLISLQNGGCPDCVENLWPEAYGDQKHPMTQNERAAWNKKNPGSNEILAGALEKDIVENHIHDEICFGVPDAKMSTYVKKYPPTVSVTLERGQQILATDWYACYRSIMNGNKPCE